MSDAAKPLRPVKPVSLEVVFCYPCPHCQRQVPLIGPTQPTMAQCDACGKPFPIVPADSRSIQFIKIMLANGGAGIDPDFL